MFIENLKLSAYRNYENFTVDLAPGCVVIYGANGAGKTNLLEAISLLAPGRGLRRAPYKQLCSINHDASFVINAKLQHSAYGEVKIGTMLNKAGTTRKISINETASLAENLTQYVNILWLTPMMDRLFLGPARDRCRFLDRLVLATDISHAKRLRDYEKLLKTRNHILQESHAKNKLLDVYEINLVNISFEIVQARRYLLNLLQQALDNSKYKDLFIEATIEIKGEIEDLFVEYEGDALLIDKIAQKFYENRTLDKISARAKFGAHRSDFHVEYSKKSMPAILCSTGEQKALILHLLLLQMELNQHLFNRHTILLLDEIAAHLDKHKFNLMLDLLAKLPSQIIMTATNKNLFQAIEDKVQFIKI